MIVFVSFVNVHCSLPLDHSHDIQMKPWKSKFCDWFIILSLFGVTVVLELPNTSPYHQCIPGYTTNADGSFLCGDAKDPSLEYPYKPQTITEVLLVVCALGPWIITLLLNAVILCCRDKTRSIHCRAVLKDIEILLRMMMFSAASTQVCVYSVST